MATNNLRIQQFRSNDLVDNSGKQFELGKKWCEEFFEIPSTEITVEIDLIFKPISPSHINLSDKIIKLSLSEVNKRGDRKAYSNGENGRSKIKNFFIDDLHLNVENNLCDYFAIYKTAFNEFYLYYVPELLYKNFINIFQNTVPHITIHKESIPKHFHGNSLQQIYYGAPGTGKSHRIKEQLKGVSKENIFRTTFHPDSDYSTFVGAYKPSKGKRPLYGLNGTTTVRLNDGGDLSEETITYKFIPQAFLNAYMQAYKKPDENAYLIIEEINRGNCAQIFGDLFQLLDRDTDGKSEYTIKADADLRAYLEEELGIDNDAIKDGELCLPSNLYIYATMNTSDQSLFPIDSAFKRRWDWEYEPIKYKNTDWAIDIQGEKYSWVSFQREINKRIFDSTNSEDKMLGDYFVNPTNGIITEKMLLNKILFYLWNDVCKDGDNDIFKTTDTDNVSFSDLYGDENKQILVAMMSHLGIERIKEEEIDDDYEESEEIEEYNDNGNSQTTEGKDYSKYSINGEYLDENGKAFGKGAIVKRAVEIYCQNNLELTANEIRDNWINAGFTISHIVETKEDKQERLKVSKDKTGKVRDKELKLANGESIYVSVEVGRHNFSDFLLKINAKPEWGIKIEKVQ